MKAGNRTGIQRRSSRHPLRVLAQFGFQAWVWLRKPHSGIRDLFQIRAVVISSDAKNAAFIETLFEALLLLATHHPQDLERLQKQCDRIVCANWFRAGSTLYAYMDITRTIVTNLETFSASWSPTERALAMAVLLAGAAHRCEHLQGGLDKEELERVRQHASDRVATELSQVLNIPIDFLVGWPP